MLTDRLEQALARVRRHERHVRRAVRRPRPVQGGERHARPHGRRPAARRGRAPDPGRGARDRHRRASRRRRVRRAVRGHRRRAPRDATSPSASSRRCRRRSVSATTTSHVSASIGIALSADGTETADALLANADIAMYRAKEQRPELLRAVRRGDAAVGHDAGRARDRAAPRGAARRAAAVLPADHRSRHRRRSAASRRCVRWERPGFGLVAPDEFIPTAEETGLIIDIGAWVLDEACRHAAAWCATVARAAPRHRGERLQPPTRSPATSSTSSRRTLARTGLDPTHAHARAHREHAHRRHRSTRRRSCASCATSA